MIESFPVNFRPSASAVRSLRASLLAKGHNRVDLRRPAGGQIAGCLLYTSVLATHKDRERLFIEAGYAIVDLAKRYYEQDDATALPRNIASFKAFENAITLDIAMGGSTNTVLHLSLIHI